MTERREEKEGVQLFVVRLWSESFDPWRRAWRGEVVHVGTDDRRYFARWQHLLAFLCKAIDVSWEGRVNNELTTEVMDREQNQDRNVQDV